MDFAPYLPPLSPPPEGSPAATRRDRALALLLWAVALATVLVSRAMLAK